MDGIREAGAAATAAAAAPVVAGAAASAGVGAAADCLIAARPPTLPLGPTTMDNCTRERPIEALTLEMTVEETPEEKRIVARPVTWVALTRYLTGAFALDRRD